MSILRRITTAFGFKVQDGKLNAVNQKVATTKNRMKLAAREASNFRKKMNLAAGATTALFAVMAGSRVIKALTTDYSEAVDKAAKFSKATGVNLRTYQALGHAVQLSGGSLEDLEKALPQLAKRSFEAATGNKTLAKSFSLLGVSVKDPQGKLKDTETLFLEMSDKFKGMKDVTKRTGLAMQLFGRTGAKLMPLFLEGSVNIKKMMKEAEKLGLVMSKKAAADAEKFNDELLRAKSVVKGLRNQIAARLLPTLTKGLTRFKDWAMEGDNLTRALKRIMLAAKLAGIALAGFVSVKLLKNLGQMVQAFVALTRSIQAMGLAAALAKIKIMLLVAALVLIPLIIQDLVVFAQGGDSLIGRALGDTSDADELRKALLAMGAELKKIWVELKPALAEAWKEAKPALAAIGKELKALGPILVKGVIIYLKIMVKWLKFVPKIIRFIKQEFSKLAAIVGFVVEHIRNSWSAMTEAISDDTKGIGLVFWFMVETVKNLIASLQEAWAKMIAVVGPIMAKFVANVSKGWDVLKAAAKVVADFIGKVFSTAAAVAKASWAVVINMINKAVKLVGKVKGAVGKVRSALGLGGGDTEIVIPTLPGAPTSQVAPNRGGTQTTNATVNKVEVNVTTTEAQLVGDTGSEVRKQVRQGLQDVINQAARNFRGATV